MNRASAERKEAILDQVAERGQVSIGELARSLGVSEATVRRDLRNLAAQRRLELVHGGAMASKVGDQSLLARARRNAESKRIIGRLAANLVSDGDMLFVDSGTTCYEMRPYLLRKKAITVIVNSTRLAVELGANPEIEIILLGGHYRPERMDAVGPLTANAIDQLRGYVAFIGADGLSPEFGISANDIQTAYLYQHLLANARHAVLLADHTKFEAPSLFKICDFDAVSRVVTDRSPSRQWREFLRSRNIALEIPPSESQP